MDSLFEIFGQNNTSRPLAEKMRPQTLDDFVGQKHIVGEGCLLRRAIVADKLGSCIFYGPPGCGKTTLAHVIAQTTKSNFAKLNAVSSGVSDAKKVIDDAKRNFQMFGSKTYLLLDECHRWSKAQSDCVLSAIEDGSIIFIGSTTENPYVSMTKAIVSRCRIFEFKKVADDDILVVLKKALQDSSNGLGLYNVEAEEKALNHLIWACDGDVRVALNALELGVISTSPSPDGKIHFTLEVAEQSVQKKSLSVDENMYYDMISAFCKSLRGSDSDAAIYWAERLIQAGCDPRLIARRLIVHSSEDVGMADPQALVISTSALYAFEHLGLPEGKIPLYNAVIYVCEAPKSNSVIVALETAEEIVSQKKDDNVPMYLRDPNYKTEKIEGYKYPHLYGGWVEQNYLPDSLTNTIIYKPLDNGYESKIKRAKTNKRPRKE